MPTNFPSPYVLKYTSTTGGIVSTHKLACQVSNSPVPGTDFTDIMVTTSNGNEIALWLGVETYLGLILKSFQSGTTLSGVELFKVENNNDGLQFISAYNYNVVGDSGQPLVLSSYSLFSFRTANGGIMRITYLECAGTGNAQATYQALPTWEQALVDYIVSDDNWIFASDNSYPISFLRRSQGQNEAIWRKRNRPNS